MSVCVGVGWCVRACVLACVRECVCMRVCVCVCGWGGILDRLSDFFVLFFCESVCCPYFTSYKPHTPIHITKSQMTTARVASILCLFF